MKTIKFKEFSSRMEAEIFKSLLSSHGIESSLLADDQGGMRPSLQLTQGVSIWLKENDLSKAQSLLKKHSS